MTKIKKWWDDIPTLTTKVRKLYTKLEDKGNSDIITATYKKIISERKWGPVESIIHNNLLDVIKEHGIYYIPKGFEPGPMFVFPQYDVDGIPMKAQTKPLYDIGNGSKYWIAGDRDNFLGPSWLGNSDKMIERILNEKYVVVIEGTFDFVAVRALCPEIPALCSLTKKLGYKQEAYLRMLGVETLYLMFDQDEQGIQAAELTKKIYKSMQVELVKTPAKDASKALENRNHANILKDILYSIVEANTKTINEESRIIILEEE